MASPKKYGTENLALRDPSIIFPNSRRWRIQERIEKYSKKQLGFTGKFNRGLTKDQLTHLQFKYQENKCAICKKTPVTGLVLDHDHASGRARGFLCHRCNSHLVSIHTKETLKLVEAYLQNPPADALLD